MLEYSDSAAFWIYNRVAQFAYLNYEYIGAEVRKVADQWEFDQIKATKEFEAKLLAGKMSREAIVEETTKFSTATAQQMFDKWSNLDKYLMVKFIDGNIKLEDESYSPVWNPGESVSLRLASIGRGSFEFWNGFLEDVINAHNPIYPSSANLPSNIEGGGLGIWYGFSADYGEILLPESPSNSM